MENHNILLDILLLLATVVVTVPLFQRFGLGSVLGYLAAGVLLGPSVSGLITDVVEIRHFAEFGVLFLLFLIGIEMKPARLWLMRRTVFGLGASQVMVTGLLLWLLAGLIGLPFTTALIVGFGLALSSTAFGIQLLSERGELGTTYGRAGFSVLLFQDLAVVPLLALVPLLAPGGGETDLRALAVALAEVVMIVVLVVIGGRYVLPQLLRLVAASRNREVFSAAAVLLVLGTASLVGATGLSMALGAFMAGLLLAESEFRHQVVVDIQPFRGFLLGLFFVAVGMSIDLQLLVKNGWLIGIAVGALITLKVAVLLALSRAFGLHRRNAWQVALLLSQGGEFAFVLFGLAQQSEIMTTALFQQLILVVALSMALTPLLLLLGRRITASAVVDDLHSVPGDAQIDHVLIAAFGRVGQRIARILTEAGIPYVAIDHDPDRVAEARRLGYSVFFGDASRLEVLEAAGIANARLLISTIDVMVDGERLVNRTRHAYPAIKIHARAHDRARSLKLLDAGADVVVSETLEASLQLGAEALQTAGVTGDEATELLNRFRAKNYIAFRDTINETKVTPNALSDTTR